MFLVTKTHREYMNCAIKCSFIFGGAKFLGRPSPPKPLPSCAYVRIVLI